MEENLQRNQKRRIWIKDEKKLNLQNKIKKF